MRTHTAFKTEQGKIAILKFYDTQIENWNLTHETINIKTRYGDSFILACGEKNAPPLILLHGSGINSCMWFEDAKVYSEIYRVYAVDIPGEAGKSNEYQMPLSGSDYADWLSDIFDALAIEKASIIGISFGAWVAIKFSISNIDRVSKLILLSPLGIYPQKNSFLLTLFTCMIAGKSGKSRLYHKINLNPAVSQNILEYQKLIGKHFNSRTELMPLFADQELKRLSMPTVAFFGEKDIIIHAAKTANRLRSILPQARINILPSVGHTLINLADKIIIFMD